MMTGIGMLSNERTFSNVNTIDTDSINPLAATDEISRFIEPVFFATKDELFVFVNNFMVATEL